MYATTDRLEFAPPSTPGLLRALGLALLAHAFLLAALTWGVHWTREAKNVSAEVELWSSIPQQAAPKLAELPLAPQPPQPVPEPLEKAAAPTPPAPTQAQPETPDPDIALEREKLRKKKAKDKQQELAERQELKRTLLEIKRVQEKHEQDQKIAEINKKAIRDTERKEALKIQEGIRKVEADRVKNLKRIAGLAGATGSSTATGTILRASGPSDPSASYADRIRASVKPNIVFTDNVAGNPKAEVEVSTTPDGVIVSRKLTRSSGVISWDNAVLRAIDKTGTLPRDVDGRVISPLLISFTPKD